MDYYSNFDHMFDPSRAAVEQKLRAGEGGQHPAWGHHGQLSFDPQTEEFVEEVWIHGARAGEHRNRDLEALIRDVNDTYGHE